MLYHFHQVKSQFEAGMEWGESQMGRGKNNTLQPCAQPNCSPFPSCCTTNTAFEQQLFSPPMSAILP